MIDSSPSSHSASVRAFHNFANHSRMTHHYSVHFSESYLTVKVLIINLAMNILQVFSQFSTTKLALEYMQRRGLLRQNPPNCIVPQCNRRMTLVKASRLGDGCIWRCPSDNGCKVSIRKDSFVERQKISLTNFLLLAFFWSFSIPVATTVQFTLLSKKTVIQWYHYFRGICSRWLLDNPIRLGGPALIVQVDESVLSKKKRNRARRGRIMRQRLLFGMFDIRRRIGILRLIPNKTHETLLPLIEEHIAPGSIIHSDKHRSYCAIPAIPVIPPFTHEAVNHSRYFVDPRTGVHTNNVENFWKNAKMKFKTMSGTSPDLLPSYLDEFMWRQQNGGKSIAAFDAILDQIAFYYPV